MKNRHAIAFAAQGWIWLLDLESGEATRLTNGPGVDGRPRWSADGSRIAFVRDEHQNRDTAIVLLDLVGGDEQLIDTQAIELDPEFSADGRFLYFTSGENGSLELRRRHLEAGTDQVLTDLDQVVRNARTLSGTDGWVDFHRTPAMGTGRAYVRTGSADTSADAVIDRPAQRKS